MGLELGVKVGLGAAEVGLAEADVAFALSVTGATLPGGGAELSEPLQAANPALSVKSAASR